MSNLTKQIIELAKTGQTPAEISQNLNYPEEAVKAILSSPMARKLLEDLI